MRVWICALILALFLSGCDKEEAETQGPAPEIIGEDLESLEESVPYTSMQTMAFMEQEDPTLNFQERLELFKTQALARPDDPFLVQKAEGLWIEAPRTDFKARLELAFWLMNAYKRDGDLLRAEEYAGEYRGLMESVKGGVVFRKHRDQIEKVSSLSEKWGDTE